MNKYLNLKNYLNFIYKNILNFCAPFIKIWEKKYFKKYASQSLKHQPVFIIGAPRTRSTILYQVITNQLDVLYIDNLVCWFNKNIFFGFWLSNKLFNQKAHNCFESIYGNTSKFELHAPSECGAFWYKWLPTHRHFIDYNDITDKMINEIREEITTVINYFDKPLVFKNLNAGQRLRLLSKCFPDAKFIFIKRDPLFTSQSILKAKRKLNLLDNEYWGIMSRNFEILKNLNYSEQIIKQIFYIEKQIMEDSKLFNKENFLIIKCTRSVNNFKNLFSECQKFISFREKKNYKKIVIDFAEKLVLKESEIKNLQQEIRKLNWNDYNVY